MTPVTTAADDAGVLRALRDIPPGAARDELVALLGDAIAFVLDPRCPECQGDGSPCASVDLACEQCRHVVATLRTLRGELLAASGATR